MSERPAISLKGVGKRYTLYPSPFAGACDALGLSRFIPGMRASFRQFWALRNVNLTLPRGSRIGIVGRNGAGKSTLLKLITGNVDPTEGEIEVDGEVQALLQAGTSMHPEFTGYENIEAALTYQGLSASEIQDAIADIEDFTELGPFLNQPFKTYSTGMQARLAFATATVVKPDILIVDELLGVGDGYFLSKSTERMEKLIHSGATVLLVSHSMEQILRFSEQAVWIDRGQVVRQGDTLEVIKEYERYLLLLDERRLRANNARARLNVETPGKRMESENQFTDGLTVRFRVSHGARLRVGAIALSENDRPQDRLHVGGPQDASPGNSTHVSLDDNSAWSAPISQDGRMFRELHDPNRSLSGDVVFWLYLFDTAVTYAFEINYCLQGADGIVEMCRGDTIMQSMPLPATDDWSRMTIACQTREAPAAGANASGQHGSTLKAVHWPGLGGLRIESVRILDEHGKPGVHFLFGKPITFEVQIVAEHDGTFPLLPALSIYRRSDGVNVTQCIGPSSTHTVAQGDTILASLRLDPVQMCNDTYVVAVVLLRTADPFEIKAPERYDLLDRSVEFKVHGREPYRRGVFQHPGDWTIEKAKNTMLLKSAG